MGKSQRKTVFDKYKGHCAYCGCVLSESTFTVDHLNPLSKGGKNSVENMLPACFECNQGKADYTLKELHKLYPNEKFYFEMNKKRRKTKSGSQILKKGKSVTQKTTGECLHQLSPLRLVAVDGKEIKGKVQMYRCTKCNDIFYKI